ncbi:harbinger transposase derived 1 [Nesidiocoris tenuis]|uniref:Putative nuclease HARBI1 n=1 Tax=Nesidiocoris tenuis TaxID=355587 RepID=A0ABN7B747_9HEMI|nr:harbinger transposase derived 1 [Nesidiocoris tenuis]
MGKKEDMERIRSVDASRSLRMRIRQQLHYTDLSDKEFQKTFRFPKTFVESLINNLSKYLKSGISTKIPASMRILAALRFYVSGGYQEEMGYSITSYMSRPVISRSIQEVTNLLNILSHRFIRFPKKPEDVEREKAGFQRLFGLPDVVGVVDCTQVAVTKPGIGSKEKDFNNQLDYASINIQIISQSKNRIIAIYANFPGGVHDYEIWETSAIRKHLLGKYVDGDTSIKLLGDLSYTNEPWLLTEFDNDIIPGTREEKFNNALRSCHESTARKTIGLLKSRFKCLSEDHPLHYNAKKSCDIVVACAVLHNLAIDHGVDEPELLFDKHDSLSPVLPNLIDSNREIAHLGSIERNKYVASHFS